MKNNQTSKLNLSVILDYQSTTCVAGRTLYTYPRKPFPHSSCNTVSKGKRAKRQQDERLPQCQLGKGGGTGQ